MGGMEIQQFLYLHVQPCRKSALMMSVKSSCKAMLPQF